jgi:hypothetical protein
MAHDGFKFIQIKLLVFIPLGITYGIASGGVQGLLPYPMYAAPELVIECVQLIRLDQCAGE